MKIIDHSKRIRGRMLRTETLDRSNARDLEQVVRILREAKLHSAKFCSPVSPSSTPQDGRKTEVKNIFAVQEYSTS